MANRTKKPYPTTKKHLARLERERLQRRYIIIASAVVLLLIVGVILYGVLQQSVLKPGQAVAIVNGEKISTHNWQEQVRFNRLSLIRSAEQTAQLAQYFGSDPNTLASFGNQLQQIKMQMDPNSVGQNTMDQMTEDLLIQQEAKKRGITITQDEIDQAFKGLFGYFPAGTPTPQPTFEEIPTGTLSPLQMTLIPPTATPTATPIVTSTVISEPITATVTLEPTSTPTPTPTGVITPTATPLPSPTPTEYTEQGYLDLYKQNVDAIAKLGITEKELKSMLRYLVTSQLYREKLTQSVIGDLPHTENQVWARHILVQDAETAKEIHSRLVNGEDFCKLAAEFSTDTSNKDNCGDLGWFGSGKMVAEFEKAAFALNAGEISQPVQTQFGWHILQSLGKEDRPLTSTEYDQLRQQKFQNWLTDLKSKANIEIKDFWTQRVPQTPTLPAEIDAFIQQILQINITPTPQP